MHVAYSICLIRVMMKVFREMTIRKPWFNNKNSSLYTIVLFGMDIV